MRLAIMGRITESKQTEQLIATRELETAFLACPKLRNPRWAHTASGQIGHRVNWTLPLDRGKTVWSAFKIDD